MLRRAERKGGKNRERERKREEWGERQLGEGERGGGMGRETVRRRGEKV